MDINKVYKLANKIIQHRDKSLGFEILDTMRGCAVGQYDPVRRVVGLKRSFAMMSSKVLIKDVILHEIAHSIVGDHNNRFKKACKELGCKNDEALLRYHIAPSIPIYRGG